MPDALVGRHGRVVGRGAARLRVAGGIAGGAARRRWRAVLPGCGVIAREPQLHGPVGLQDEAGGVRGWGASLRRFFRRPIGGGVGPRFLQQGLQRVAERICQAIREPLRQATCLTVSRLTVSRLAYHPVEGLTHLTGRVWQGGSIQRTGEHGGEGAAGPPGSRFGRGLVGRGSPQHVEQLLQLHGALGLG